MFEKIVIPSTSRKYLIQHAASDCKTALDSGCFKWVGNSYMKGQECSSSQVQIKDSGLT